MVLLCTSVRTSNPSVLIGLKWRTTVTTGHVSREAWSLTGGCKLYCRSLGAPQDREDLEGWNWTKHQAESNLKIIEVAECRWFLHFNKDSCAKVSSTNHFLSFFSGYLGSEAALICIDYSHKRLVRILVHWDPGSKYHRASVDTKNLCIHSRSCVTIASQSIV